MPIVKSLAKRQISRQLFKVCRLNNLETRSQVESYFLEHQGFRELRYCSAADIEELERFIAADLLRLERKWELPRDLLRSQSIVSLAGLLLEKQLFPSRHMEVFKSSLRIYAGRPTRSLCEMAAELGTTENSLYMGRFHAVKKLVKILKSLQSLREDLLGVYGLEAASGLLLIDEARALHINSRAGTHFSPQFLSLLFGIHLEADFALLGTPVEALAGNYMGPQHCWSNFYLVKKELAASIGVEGLLQEAFRLLYIDDGEARSLNFRNFVSYFTRKTAPVDPLLPVVAEILFRELGLEADMQGQLNFPARRELLFRSYCYEALEALGEPVPQPVIRAKMSALHPEAFMDTKSFKSLMRVNYGFTNYKQHYFGLRKWYPDTGGSLRQQEAAVLEELEENYSRTAQRAESWQALMDFVHTHSRLPKRGGTREEEALRIFWKGQLLRSQQGNYYPEYREQLQELESRFMLKVKYKPLLDWDERYASVKAFSKAHGKPPNKAGTGEEKTFYNWLQRQRRFLKQGKLEQRQAVLIQHFDELFPNKRKKQLERRWNESYAELEQFVRTHSRAPRKGKEGRLERWYSQQRFQMGRKELSRRQQRLIQGIIDSYPLKDLEYKKASWHARCSELEQFAAAHSHLPRYNVAAEKALNHWFSTQKLNGIRGKLDALQLGRLQKLADTYKVPRGRKLPFDEQYVVFVDFVTVHARFPKFNLPEEVALYHWFGAQLKRARTGKLNPEQAEQVLQLWDRYGGVKRPEWIEHFRQLRAFAERYSRLPMWKGNIRRERKLYYWFIGQRARLNKGRLDQRKEKLLVYLITRYGSEG